ncbi:protein-disulfide reductase DsbD family protein [Spongiibacter nanhainus]|nr:protein-disulfide reductase DsbD [Spongiibacter nanhainus]
MIRFFLLLSLLLFSISGMAQPGNAASDDIFTAPPSAQFSTFGGDEPDFLPVEQAYQVSVSPQNGGQPDALELFWTIAEGYYLYRERFDVTASQPATGEALAIDTSYRSGKVKDDPYFGKTEVYYNSTRIAVTGFPSDQGAVLHIRSQGCADAGLCYPPRDQYFQRDDSGQFIELSEAPSGGSAAAASSKPPLPTALVADDNAGSATKLWLVLLMAAAGGAILNLMPCVFPVLGLKVLSFANAHHGKPVNHGLSYSIGVVASFVAVAALLIGLQQAGRAVGWGFQLQSPWFVAGLACLFFVLSLNLLGLFEIGGRWMNLGGDLSQEPGLKGSFFTGVLATVVASPCTAPFMGTAVGFAASQPPLVSLLVFACLGAGMALPVLLLTLFPRWLKLLPKPGQWMVTLRQFLAFPLIATAIWLAWVVGRQTGASGMAGTLLAWLLISFALWLWPLRKLGKALALVSLIAAPLVLNATLSRDTTPVAGGFDRQQIDDLRRQGRNVFLDVTADWCITCAANESLVLNTDSIQQAFADANVAYVVADWTRYDPVITDLLADYQRNGIPLYVYYPSDVNAPPIILPQVLSKGLIHDLLASQSATAGR